MECEVCKEIIPEVVEYRGKFISILDFKDIEPPYIILQTMNKYYKQQNLLNFTSIFVVSFKSKNNFIIGRANDADIPLNYPSISRNHCMLSYSQGNFYVDDLGSKFGTLLLIQNNILFLPFKEITIQIGKFLLIFKLIRTFLGYFNCFKNIKYIKMSYGDNFKSCEKKVYLKILENFNYNIVDPVEKFNSINDSSNSNESKDIQKINKEKEEINDNYDKDNDDEKTEKDERNIGTEFNENLKLRYIDENSNNFEETKKMENLNSDKYNFLRDSNTKLRMTGGSLLMKKIETNSFMNENSKINNKSNKAQNESNEILVNNINNIFNENINKRKNKFSTFSPYKMKNLLKIKNKNKKNDTLRNTMFNTGTNLNIFKKEKKISLTNTGRVKKYKIKKNK